MADEYIRKQDAVDLINKISNLDLKAKGGICVSLANLQKADVVPVVHGKWIGYDDTERFTAQCGLCGNVIDTRFGSNFCPNCGARMDGEKED